MLNPDDLYTFPARQALTIYRDESTIQQLFVSHLGAAEDWLKSGGQALGGKVGVAGLSASADRTSGQSVSYSLKDPTAQSLVLQNALDKEGRVKPPHDAQPGDYVSMTGHACVYAGQTAQEWNDWFANGVCPAPGSSAALEALEKERERQQFFIRALRGNDDNLVLLVLTEGNGPIVGAAVVWGSMVREDIFGSYNGFQVEAFGILESRIHGLAVVKLLDALMLTDRPTPPAEPAEARG